MATWYVSYDGDDSNGGTSWSDAKATIGAAVAAAANGDTINIGEGTYKEYVNASTKSLYFYGYGRVVIDGEDQRSLIYLGSDSKMYDIIFKNSPNLRAVRTRGGNVGTYFVRCHFENLTSALTSNPPALNIVGVDFSYGGIITDCSFIKCSVGFWYSENNPKDIKRNTFYSNCKVRVYPKTGVIITPFVDNLVACPIWFDDKNFGTLDYNDYYGKIYYYENSTWVEKTLNEWRAITGKDVHSISADPQFIDTTYYDLFLKETSPCKTASSTGSHIGRYGVGHHTNVLSTESVNATFSNVHINDAGQYVLDDGATEGTVTFDVIDFGETKTFKRIIWSATEDPPSSVIAHSDETSAPNYKYVEYRTSNTSFTKNASSPSWQTAWNGQELSSVSGRYFQYRIRLTTQFGV